jgi:ribosome-associated toxin RatA of RatAB toxin-antitoxin module
MRSVSTIFLVILLIATGTYASSLGLTQDDNEFPLGQAELARLTKGEVIVRENQSSDRGGRTVQAAILIDSPVQRVWNVIIDCEHAPKFMPDLKSCKFLQRTEDTAIIEQEVRVSRLLPKTTYIYRSTYQKFRRIDFKRIGGDLKDLEGSWVFESAGGGQQTIVVYSVFLDPGFFVPKWLVRQILRRNLPDVLLALRKWVLDSPSGK